VWGAKELSHLSAQACAVFLGHRTPRVVLACGAALALYRLSEAALGWEDVLGAFAASHAAVALQHGLLPRALASPPAPPRAPQWPAGRPASGWRRSGRSTRASCTPHGHGLVRGPLRGARRAAPGWTCHVPRTEPDGRRGGRERWADAPAGAVRRLTGRTRMAAPGQTLFPFNLYSTCGAGRDLHEDHHNAPYFHVCIDGVELVAPVMALAALAFGAAFAGAPALGRTATLAYWAAGLAYLWTHFFVHLPIAPRSRYAQAVRRHHMLCAHPSRGFAGLIGLGGDWAGPQRAAFCRAHGAGCASVPPGALCALRGLACLWPAPILCVVPHAPLSTRLARQGQSRALGAGAARVSCMLPLKKEGARARCGCARREAAPGAAQAPLPLGGALAVLLRAGGGRRVWHAAGVGGGGAHHAARRAAEGPHAQGGWAGILSAALMRLLCIGSNTLSLGGSVRRAATLASAAPVLAPAARLRGAPACTRSRWQGAGTEAWRSHGLQQCSSVHCR
jgi:hypothetical protein